MEMRCASSGVGVLVDLVEGQRIGGRATGRASAVRPDWSSGRWAGAACWRAAGRRRAEMAAWMSCAAASIFRLSVNCTVICVLPSEFTEFID